MKELDELQRLLEDEQGNLLTEDLIEKVISIINTLRKKYEEQT